MIRKIDHNAILDTDFLINLLQGRKEESDLIQRHSGKTFSTTSINIVELYGWAFKSKDRLKAWRDIEGLRQTLVVLNLSDSAVKHAGVLIAEENKQGRTIELRDLLVRSIAETNGCQVVSSLPPDRK